MTTHLHESAPVLTCVGCSGGAPDANGAYTLCALCELESDHGILPAAA